MSVRRDIQMAAGILLVSAANAVACGPAFPNRLLENGEAAVLQAPTAVFRKEIDRIMPRNTTPFAAAWMPPKELDYREMVSRYDLSELEEAMKEEGPHHSKSFDAYKKAREGIYSHDVARLAWRRCPTSQPPQFVTPAVPEGDGIPREFSEYLKGAVRWCQGDTNGAVKTWTNLLGLPANQRRNRSTWAAFMLGKAMLMQGDRPVAIKWFRFVRKLATAGFPDSLGLAASSLGWEARAELDLKRCGPAIELYLKQLATGDETALNSLRFAAADAWRLPEKELVSLITNGAARKVIVAHALSYDSYDGPTPQLLGKFLSAVEKAKIPIVEEADRLAWAAYRAGDMVLAERFNAVAPRDSVITALLRAKLLLRKGEEKKAIEQLSEVARNFPESPALRERYDCPSSPEWDLSFEPLGERLRGELGVLHLSRREFVQSLDLLLRGGYWQDAAYVAERVLTLEELEEYVDRNWTVADFAAVEKTLNSPYFEQDMGTKNENIRYLLGRRLVRAGEFDKAMSYLPTSLRRALDAYAKFIRSGANEKAPGGRRAEALWKAACIARYLGIELMGTEMDPDWAVYGGMYEETPLAETRAGSDFAQRVKPSHSELDRVKDSAPVPDIRFHYRYIAADLAWRAALFMPDESDGTARVLCIAGGWLKRRDAEAAKKFCRALVKRCGTTELGKEAVKSHWFPERNVDGQELLRNALGDLLPAK